MSLLKGDIQKLTSLLVYSLSLASFSDFVTPKTAGAKSSWVEARSRDAEGRRGLGTFIKSHIAR